MVEREEEGGGRGCGWMSGGGWRGGSDSIGGSPFGWLLMTVLELVTEPLDGKLKRRGGRRGPWGGDGNGKGGRVWIVAGKMCFWGWMFPWRRVRVLEVIKEEGLTRVELLAAILFSRWNLIVFGFL